MRRFHSKKSLVAFAGIDAPPYQSGQMDIRSRSISKRGSASLRTEVTGQKVGFRKFELKNNRMLLNGKRIVFKGEMCIRDSEGTGCIVQGLFSCTA